MDLQSKKYIFILVKISPPQCINFTSSFTSYNIPKIVPNWLHIYSKQSSSTVSETNTYNALLLKGSI